MRTSIIDLAVPFFIVLVAVESVFSAIGKRKVYRWNDTVADLSTGVLFSLTGVAVTAASLWVYENFRIYCSLQTLFGVPEIPLGNPFRFEEGLFRFDPASFAGWSFVFLAVDFVYYWFHRATHEVNFLWACHVTHHSSEEFNLSVALRQSSFQRVFEYAFNLTIAFCGVPWEAFLFAHGILKIYQFWVHTRLIGKLGFLEEILVTPAHHRVHHGRDPKYIDKNHGGILIFWDRMFGSFAREEEEPVYGLTKPVTTFDPIFTNLHVYREMWELFGRIPNWKDKFLLLIKPPGWRPAVLGASVVPSPIDRTSYRKYDPIVSKKRKIFGVAEFIVWTVLSLVSIRLFKSGNLALWKLIPLSLTVAFGFWHTAKRFDGSEIETNRIRIFFAFAAAVLWILWKF
ncbi:sterol desaturase family protein [Leptospira gomenensis]|uniref:Sterol desaturase family protein n=1 Tax=Leptospira gomenensis TaxID=2484974 RepID=A0A5F1YEP8_9LEPT|nr:sterol desaturase family protein [Leptospira gomenensis]TGK37575.1 sterol desaturase family protein [Leptospira gomenensis]TGK39418.1 sterol desaturase family protein [Leptospira gomenensis]TGK43160.1 sterol desaturase family protein [Leptospira gomenensis]TGK55011.1 sterol desaturase family protein [Leptospira gomenensis]